MPHSLEEHAFTRACEAGYFSLYPYQANYQGNYVFVGATESSYQFKDRHCWWGGERIVSVPKQLQTKGE